MKKAALRPVPKWAVVDDVAVGAVEQTLGDESDQLQETLERFTARQRKHCIQPMGRKFPDSVRGIIASCIDHAIRAQTSNQLAGIISPGRAQHSRIQALRKLHR